MLLGHGGLFRRPSNEQSWKNLNKRVIVVFDYNPKNKINTYVSILKQEFQLVMKNKLGKLKKKSPLDHYNIIVIGKTQR